jgi:hypothetical protein
MNFFSSPAIAPGSSLDDTKLRVCQIVGTLVQSDVEASFPHAGDLGFISNSREPLIVILLAVFKQLEKQKQMPCVRNSTMWLSSIRFHVRKINLIIKTINK